CSSDLLGLCREAVGVEEQAQLAVAVAAAMLPLAQHGSLAPTVHRLEQEQRRGGVQRLQQSSVQHGRPFAPAGQRARAQETTSRAFPNRSSTDVSRPAPAQPARRPRPRRCPPVGRAIPAPRPWRRAPSAAISRADRPYALPRSPAAAPAARSKLEAPLPPRGIGAAGTRRNLSTGGTSMSTLSDDAAAALAATLCDGM